MNAARCGYCQQWRVQAVSSWECRTRLADLCVRRGSSMDELEPYDGDARSGMEDDEETAESFLGFLHAVADGLERMGDEEVRMRPAWIAHDPRRHHHRHTVCSLVESTRHSHRP